MPEFSRRSFVTGPLFAAGCAALPAHAAAPAKMQGLGVYRYRLGGIQLTALYDGIWYVPIDGKFVRNASTAESQRRVGRGFPAAERAAGLVHRTAGQH